MNTRPRLLKFGLFCVAEILNPRGKLPGVSQTHSLGERVSEYVIGQRWVSQPEASLGLGIIIDIQGRQLKIRFPAVGEERLYAAHSAPLTRIEYKPGETIRTADERHLKVLEVEADQGCLRYIAKDEAGNVERVDEADLNSFVEFNTPEQRLLSGQLDHDRAYRLRCETLAQYHRLQQSPARGLLGSRTSLLPHQTYIAREVAGRFAPRVLLADEVGLGKTIEAGMILHYQLLSGLAERVLIVVPETLTHQWLVEMLRRFNLRFALFNAERLYGLRAGPGNPFESEQLIICSLSELTADPGVFHAALSAAWDLLVVDEAHHLHYAEGEAGHDYDCIRALSERCPGLLLLTGTPGQIGVAGHFARLRLLDPARFYDPDVFLEEERGYKALNETVSVLLDRPEAALTDAMLAQLKRYLDDEAPASPTPDPQERMAIVDKLLDRHGTGRVFLRNTRAAIKGFPERRLVACPLPMPELYAALSGPQTLFPEMKIEDESWLQEDPRVAWLIDFLNELRPAKVLLICAWARTARALEHHLRFRAGLRSTVFHEGLSIIERDRAAAYFAEHEGGAQLLVCSEIGSEGRNFQFAHHLVLFDLPLNPDLLEQRIGRLDRIGQTETVHIHVPCLKGSAQQVLFDWYHQGLNLFAESCAAAYDIYEKFAEPLEAALAAPGTDISALLEATARHTAEVKEALKAGRDRLVELNSCRKAPAEQIIAAIREAEAPAQLMAYMEQMFSVFGISHEEHSANSWILHPDEHGGGDYFPGIGSESTTVTFDRNKALSREDFGFLSWEHPLVSDAMDMVLGSETGNANIATIQMNGIAPGTILLETYATISAIAPKRLRLGRYLPLTPLRTLISRDQKDYAKILPHQTLNELCQKVDRQTAHAVINQIKGEIETMIDFARRTNEARLPGLKQAAAERAETLLGAEIKRLRQLQKKNSLIRKEEIDHLEAELDACASAINDAGCELQALRLVIAQ